MKTNTTLITCSHQLSLQHEFQSFMEQIWITLVISASFRPACEHNLFFHGSTQHTDSFPTPLEKQFLPPQQSSGLLSLNSRWKQHQRTFLSDLLVFQIILQNTLVVLIFKGTFASDSKRLYLHVFLSNEMHISFTSGKVSQCFTWCYLLHMGYLVLPYIHLYVKDKEGAETDNPLLCFSSSIIYYYFSFYYDYYVPATPFPDQKKKNSFFQYIWVCTWLKFYTSTYIIPDKFSLIPVSVG